VVNVSEIVKDAEEKAAEVRAKVEALLQHVKLVSEATAEEILGAVAADVRAAATSAEATIVAAKPELEAELKTLVAAIESALASHGL
jgi:ElaB/YqjD/DUF883 family membrane-anchored ribosome-binding protein